MRKIQIGIIILIFGLALALQGCGGGTTPKPNPLVPGPSNVVHVKANIGAPTTWTSDNLYVLDNGISVTAALTIQAGTIIKIALGAYISVDGAGSINAVGTSSTPITFTSIRDDSIGGDTNEDGTATVPVKGNWTHIIVRGADSIFDYCRFYYGGGGTYEDDALVEVVDVGPTFTNCTFAHSLHAGLELSGALETTIVTGNTFFDNAKPLWINPNISLNNSNVFHDPAHPTQGNAFNGIWIPASVGFSVDTNWGETEVAFVLTGSITFSATWTLQPGVTVKLSPGTGISGSGVLVATGNSANHITFTSYLDDTKGGDSNNNGSATAPAKGDWGSIHITTNGSNFTYCDFYYGGAGNYNYTAIMAVSYSAIITIDNCIFAHSKHAALDIEGVDPDNSVVTNNAFYDSTMPLWMNPNMSIDDTNIFHNPADATQKNAQNGIWLEASSGIDASRTWGVTEVPYICPTFVIYNNIINITLSIASGAILKFDGTRLDIGAGASINGIDNVTFTSIKEDARGGDTNGDGADTFPAANDWVGVQDSNGWITTANIHFDTHSGNL